MVRTSPPRRDRRGVDGSLDFAIVWVFRFPTETPAGRATPPDEGATAVRAPRPVWLVRESHGEASATFWGVARLRRSTQTRDQAADQC